jgi:hypothetical protein
VAILHDDHKQTLFVSEGGARADWIHFDDSRTPFTVKLGLLTLHQAEASIKHPLFMLHVLWLQLDNYSVWTIILTWQTTRRRLTDQDVFRRSPGTKSSYIKRRNDVDTLGGALIGWDSMMIGVSFVDWM